MPIYFGMRVIITENHANLFRNKAGGFFNGNLGVVHSLSNHTLFVRCNLKLIAIFPVTNQQNDTYYPIRPVYSVTVAKAQGQTIPHVTIWFDKPKSSTATALCRHVTCSFLSMHLLFKAVHGKSFRTKSTIAYFFSLVLLLRANAIRLHCSEGPAISKSLTMSCCYFFG